MNFFLKLTAFWLFAGGMPSSEAQANQPIQENQRMDSLQTLGINDLKVGNFIAQQSYVWLDKLGFSLFNPVIEFKIIGHFKPHQPPARLIITKPTKPPYDLENPLSIKISLDGWSQFFQYDNQVELRELCLSPKQQTFSLLFHQWDGGMSDPGDYFSLSYGEASQKFVKQDIEDSHRGISLFI